MEHRSSTKDWANWLATFQWEYFVTLTLKREISPQDLQRTFVNSYIRRLAKSAQQPLSWFVSVEHGPNTRTHAHALIYSGFKLHPNALSRTWKLGSSDVKPYNQSVGVAYVVKAVASRNSYYDVSKSLPPKAVSLPNKGHSQMASCGSSAHGGSWSDGQV